MIFVEDISVSLFFASCEVGLGVLLCSSEDFIDYCCLGISVVLHVFRVVAGKLPLGALVEETVGFVVAQPVAEEQHAVDFGTAC